MKRESVKKASLILVAVLTTIASSESVSQTPPSRDPNSEWTGTAEQKIWGLMTVWAEAKYAFPFFDQNPELNWDSTVQAYIPRVIAAADQISYYKLLMELAARLHDGHTAVLPPWGLFEPGTDCPPIEVQVVENKFVIARVGESDELAAQKITPGLEILEIGDGVPIAEYHRDSVLRYNSRGTKQADESINLWSLLYGTADSKVRLKIKDRSGAERTVLLTRNSTCRSGERFQCRLFQWYMAGDVLETRALPDGAVYVCIKNFGNDDLGARFRQMLDTLNLAQVSGMIVDLRHNPGGDSQIADSVSACLIDTPLPTSVWHIPHYIAADRAWGNPPEWTERQDTIRPYTGKRYLGPLVILTGPSTYSAAEDFIIPLHAARRAVLVGESTAGSSGNPLRVPLPGGGNFRVVSCKMTYPDGRDYIGIGIKPDHEVVPRQDDLYDGYDRVLEEGIRVLKSLPPANR